MRSKELNPFCRFLVGLSSASILALPARAEGGTYPSEGFLLGLLFLFGFGIPLAISIAAYALIKQLRQPKMLVLLPTAMLVWDVGLGIYVEFNIRLPISDYVAALLGIGFSLIITVAVGLWTASVKPSGKN